ncbi:putative s-adenosyl-l-methionine:delta24-sterol-C-methyltransferase [Corchorus capsularis]|uniref:Putative s-adenosyl-l-methionine:delta24-sterol-C-methyltransferase n=1 Tax=Corchorus capsularis TaxID=210143 RepID=A0A1R3J1I8_COCAP|nr:putative s-adenosyl-l-methionine:delta24-sterol-C-methyltransferase [Corchorus capsularis]
MATKRRRGKKTKKIVARSQSQARFGPFEIITTDIAKESVYTVSIPSEFGYVVGFLRIVHYLRSVTFSLEGGYKIHVLKDDNLGIIWEFYHTIDVNSPPILSSPWPVLDVGCGIRGPLREIARFRLTS